ncbi:hypothetical protein [Aquiflexum sp.]|uniref:hypothetical protein n=1 Tax=Aquiflexum sp. TaxID=1872584 RepID=UPI0035946A7F
MKRLFSYFLFFLIFSCEDKETPLWVEIEDRETIAEINNVRAFIDVEQIGESLDSGFVFRLELMDSPTLQFLHVGDDRMICSFLNEQMMFGSTRTVNCAGIAYYNRYLGNGFKTGNYRMHVNISGQIKKRNAKDIFTGEPFVLESITKIPTCPISFDIKNINSTLENNFWQLQAFLNENGEILSYPTCEDPEIGVFFYDSLVQGFPIDVPEAKTFEILTEVWTRIPQLFNVYSFDGEGKIKISAAFNPSWMPPRPATAQTTNFSNLTVDIKNKYDSLNLILRSSAVIEYSLNQNVLELNNPETKVRARFFNP